MIGDHTEDAQFNITSYHHIILKTHCLSRRSRWTKGSSLSRTACKSLDTLKNNKNNLEFMLQGLHKTYSQQLHQPHFLVDRGVQIVQLHLSDLVARYHQSSPVALEDQGTQEGLDLPEIKPQLVWGCGTHDGTKSKTNL